MDFEPQKFFIGLIDFFSILLPGAVLTYLLKGTAGPWVLGNNGYHRLIDTEAEKWIVFLFASYLLGHFLFLIGSLLDDYVYDPIRKRTDKEQITRLLNGRELSPRFIRWLASLCFKKRADAAVDRVVQIKENYLKQIVAPAAINAFQWCKARLAIDHPEALAMVNRFEADSKFFRSFIPVLLILFGTTIYQFRWELVPGLMILLGLAFWRYMEQRFKSTQQAYWFILTLEAGKQSPLPNGNSMGSSISEEDHGGPTHAGGVVFRKQSDETEYLLVQAQTDPHQWVLPKGHIEPGEGKRRCAIREVKEETGIWARIKNELKVIKYTAAGTPVEVQFYLMEAVEEGKPNEWRKHVWLPLDKAFSRASHTESQELLRLAEQRRTRT